MFDHSIEIGHFKFGNDGIIDFNEISSFSSAKCKTGLFEYKTFLEKLPDNPVFIKKTNPLYDVVVTYNTDRSVCEGKEKKFIIKII